MPFAGDLTTYSGREARMDRLLKSSQNDRWELEPKRAGLKYANHKEIVADGNAFLPFVICARLRPETDIFLCVTK